MSEKSEVETPLKTDEYPSPVYGWYVVVILTLAYVVSFLDRQILALMVQPIKADMGLSDTQISLLIGLAFAIFYTVLGVPIGRLADRRSRRSIIAVGITLWSLMTAACGITKAYWQLFLARVGVGVGEATLAPSALSLISDYFPRNKRARPISFYNMGISLGAGIAMLFGGWIIQIAKPITLPLIGDIFAWQTVFLIVGLPGLFVAALMLTVKEPSRKDKIALTQDEPEEIIPFGEVIRYLLDRKRTYLSHFFGMSVVTILGYIYFSWLITCFIRTWGWAPQDIAYAYGVIILICGPVGVNLGGYLADMLYAKGYKDAHMRTALFLGGGLIVPFSVLVPIMPNPTLALIMLVPATIGGAVATATGAAGLMMIVPNQMRGQTTAIYYFVISFLGLTVGPTSVALVTDFVFQDDGALRYSIAIVSGVAGIIAMGFLGYNLQHFRASMEEAESWASKDTS